MRRSATWLVDVPVRRDFTHLSKALDTTVLFDDHVELAAGVVFPGSLAVLVTDAEGRAVDDGLRLQGFDPGVVLDLHEETDGTPLILVGRVRRHHHPAVVLRPNCHIGHVELKEPQCAVDECNSPLAGVVILVDIRHVRQAVRSEPPEHQLDCAVRTAGERTDDGVDLLGRERAHDVSDDIVRHAVLSGSDEGGDRGGLGYGVLGHRDSLGRVGFPVSDRESKMAHKSHTVPLVGCISTLSMRFGNKNTLISTKQEYFSINIIKCQYGEPTHIILEPLFDDLFALKDRFEALGMIIKDGKVYLPDLEEFNV